MFNIQPSWWKPGRLFNLTEYVFDVLCVASFMPIIRCDRILHDGWEGGGVVYDKYWKCNTVTCVCNSVI